MSSSPLNEILRRVVWELEALSDLATKIDQTVAQVSPKYPELSKEPVMQEIDLLRQSIQDVTRVVDHAADEVGPEVHVDHDIVVDLTKLHDLRERLLGEILGENAQVEKGAATFF